MTEWRTRIAFWIRKATNTNREYVIRIASSLQQWLNECASMLRFSALFFLNIAGKHQHKLKHISTNWNTSAQTFQACFNKHCLFIKVNLILKRNRYCLLFNGVIQFYEFPHLYERLCICSFGYFPGVKL